MTLGLLIHSYSLHPHVHSLTPWFIYWQPPGLALGTPRWRAHSKLWTDGHGPKGLTFLHSFCACAPSSLWNPLTCPPTSPGQLLLLPRLFRCCLLWEPLALLGRLRAPPALLIQTALGHGLLQDRTELTCDSLPLSRQLSTCPTRVSPQEGELHNDTLSELNPPHLEQSPATNSM